MSLSAFRKGAIGGAALGVMIIAGLVMNQGQMVPSQGIFVSGTPSAGESPQWDGVQYRSRQVNDYRSTHLEFSEEFLGTPSNMDFTSSVSGTGATVVSVSATGGAGARPGILSVETGTTTTGFAQRRSAGNIFSGDWTKVVYEATLGPLGVSTAVDEYVDIVGCYSTSGSATQTSGAFFLYDRGNVATGGVNAGNAHKWEAFTANGGTRTRVLLDGTSQDGTTGGAGSITTVNSPVTSVSLPNTNFHTYRVTINSTASAVFEIDNVTVATLSTNLPASNVNLVCGTGVVKSAGTVDKAIYMDRHRLAIDLPLVRSP